MRDLGAQLPMRAIGMLLGIPDEHQLEVRDQAEERVRTEPGKPRDFASTMSTGRPSRSLSTGVSSTPPTT